MSFNIRLTLIFMIFVKISCASDKMCEKNTYVSSDIYNMKEIWHQETSAFLTKGGQPQRLNVRRESAVLNLFYISAPSPGITQFQHVLSNSHLCINQHLQPRLRESSHKRKCAFAEEAFLKDAFTLKNVKFACYLTISEKGKIECSKTRSKHAAFSRHTLVERLKQELVQMGCFGTINGIDAIPKLSSSDSPELKPPDDENFANTGRNIPQIKPEDDTGWHEIPLFTNVSGKDILTAFSQNDGRNSRRKASHVYGTIPFDKDPSR